MNEDVLLDDEDEDVVDTPTDEDDEVVDTPTDEDDDTDL
jgi:hypothetical protein